MIKFGLFEMLSKKIWSRVAFFDFTIFKSFEIEFRGWWPFYN